MTEPLAPASISLRLYPHDLAPREVVTELMAQARVTEAAGFDGVMTSEHHAGFPNYLPNPLLAATWALEATEHIWAAASPMLLPLRNVNQIIEDYGWTSHRFPGRVGAGFAAGALRDDFDLSGVPFEEMVPRFKEALPKVVAGLRGEPEGLLAADPGVQALREHPVPVVSAAQSPAAGRRAAALGIGLLYDSLVSVERAAEISRVHREGGGDGARILIRRVWLGEPPADAVAVQMERFRDAASASTQRHWGEGDSIVASTDAAEVAEGLAALVASTGSDALNLRVFHAGISPAQARSQIERIGLEVLPLLRAMLAAQG